jgi:O-antigen/teichoic acid export membrane protein
LANYGLFYGLSVYLARTLDADGFEEYSVAVATVLMLASFATLGLEKFALRALPGYHEKRDWSHAFGFAAFGARVRTLDELEAREAGASS